MQLVLLLVAALAPVAVLVYYIYRRDKYKKEPVRELLKAFGYGILSVPIALCMSVPLSSVGLVPAEPSTLWGAVGVSFLGAAIPEEIAKYLMLLLFLRKSRFFDERMDGIVYASVVSMGFAAVENVLYLVSNYDAWVSVGITRALFSVPAHFFFGVLMGYYYSLHRFCPSDGKAYKWLVLGAPILAHGLFDSVLFSVNVMPSLSLVLMILFLFLCNSLRKRACRSIAEHLKLDSKLM